MSESSALPSGTEADRQEQGTIAPSGTAGPGPVIVSDGTGGSEADLQEQAVLAESAETTDTGSIGGEGTGGSEADRLEQAAVVPLEGEDAFPYGAADEDGPQ